MDTDTPVSIYDMPPPSLVDLRDAIREARTRPLNYWDALLIGAAKESYTRHVQEHYDQVHGSGGQECDCE